MDYQLDKWKRQDWRKNTRCHSCEVRQNLFGQWVVLRRWGRVSAMQGQCIKVVCDSLSERQSQRYEEDVEIFEAVRGDGSGPVTTSTPSRVAITFGELRR